MGRLLKFFLVAAALSLVAQRVSADTVDHFDYQAGALDLQWELPIPLSPSALQGQVSDGSFFSVPVTFTGTSTPGIIFFFAASFGLPGELQIIDTTANMFLADALGPQVYGGTESAPTFVPTVYSLTDELDPNNPIAATLTIQEVQVAPVPEPSSGLLLGSGLLVLAIGFAVKKLIS